MTGMRSTFFLLLGLLLHLGPLGCSRSDDDDDDGPRTHLNLSKYKQIGHKIHARQVDEDRELPYWTDSIRPSVRMVGGGSAENIYLPFMVSLRRSRTNEHYCGGSIIARRWVITAAHCLTLHDGSPILIIAGSKYLGSTGVRYQSSYYVAHPFFDDTTMSNDIGLLYTDYDFQFNRDVQPIKLPRTPVPAYSGHITGLVAGWGYTDSTLKNSPVLQYLYLRLIPNTECRLRFASEPTIVIRTSQLCALHSYGHGSCTADSGGPLVIKDVLAGLVSFSSNKGCATGAPEVYTNVWSFMTWIRNVMVTQELWGKFYQDQSFIGQT